MALSLLTTITLEGLEEVGISAQITALALLTLTLILILKFLNIAKFAQLYDTPYAFVTLFIASLSYAFIAIGLYMHPTELFAVYLNISTFLYTLTWIFFVIEMIQTPVKTFTGRKQTRFARD